MRILPLTVFLCLFAAVRSQIFGGHCLTDHLCTEHGECAQGPIVNTFWCRCHEGYGGNFCEQKCHLKCKDYEKCSFDAEGNPFCLCQEGQCQTHLISKHNPCADNPCKHGMCLPFDGGFQCVCDNGFGGSYCEIGYDHCKSHYCGVGGTCVNSMAGASCICPPGRTGPNCESVDCSQLTGICNHGTCVPSSRADKKFECLCNEGYAGEWCSQDRNECLMEGMCFNNGTCVNLPGSFRCDCPSGFRGDYCQDRVDLCESHTCENGGICVHTSYQLPVCQCKNGFIGHRCEKPCPAGFGGRRCELPIKSRYCSKQGAACYNGGACIRGFCICPPDFIGNQCEVRRMDLHIGDNTCKSDPCMNNATCVDVDANIGYACLCRPGFEGDICERKTDFCTHNPCANGGICHKEDRSFRCECIAGFSGEQCDRVESFECAQNPCANGGTCSISGSKAKCTCLFGFTGPKCEEAVDLIEPRKAILQHICEKRNCSALAGNGVCDPECNKAACGFDGGDCSGGQQPFTKCSYGLKCADVFANGVCNQECNNEACLYDGMDCMSAVIRCPVKIRDHCAERFGNGVCDEECNSDGCGFDGGDCAVQALLLTDIRVKIQMDPAEFQAHGGETLMELSLAIRATVRIQMDEKGPLVFLWDGEKETGRLEMDMKRLQEKEVVSPVIRRTRSIATGIVLYLEVKEVCREDCKFSTAQSVVDLIAAGLAKTNGQTSLGLPITEAMVASPRRPEASGWSWNQIAVVGLIAFLAFGTVVAGVIVKTSEPERSRKRKMVNAPVWIPPMESGADKGRRNQSTSSSQRSLLETNGYFDAKRHCDYEEGFYQPIYPHNFEVPAEQIPLHVQASGSGPIQEPLTLESVNQIDAKYQRRVLHWLAANTNGKPEDMITSESVDCIKAGADVNARDCDENTALMLAVRARRVRLAVVLMRAGADPTIYNRSERSALHEAVVNHDLRMMTNLLTDKRLVKDIDELDRNGMTALMQVARSDGDYQVEMAQLLISKGAKIDADGASRKDSEIYKGRTALHYAALVDNVPMVEFLVSRNANKDKQDEAGKTPVMLAAKEGHECTVKFLVMHGASLTTVDAMDKTAAQLAQANYHHAIADFLAQVAVERNSRQTAVHMAPAKGRQTCKAVKRAGSRKAPSTSSRESNHLTPPPSDGSFSSPSPHYFHTTSSTPNALESSPEYSYRPEMTSSNQMWYSSTSPYQEYPHAPMPPNHVYTGTSDAMNNSFYC